MGPRKSNYERKEMETYRRKDRRQNSLDIQIIQDIKKNSTWEPEEQKTEDPADPSVGINRHAAVKGKEEIHSPKGQGVYRQLRTGRPFVPHSPTQITLWSQENRRLISFYYVTICC